jgi:RNA-directed DNA polymerase
MKRINNIYQNICSIENLQLAEKKARKGKQSQYGIKIFDKNPDTYLLLLHEALINKTFKTSKYTTFTIFEPKERIVYRLPYYPDRIVHHAVMVYMEGIFVSMFTNDTYSCIKGKGIHAASFGLRKALSNNTETTYCLKLDIKKFYPNIDHDILKQLLRRKLKDKDLLWLLDEIIDSAPGLPIGNYLSQYFANFYLTYFDHWLKEVKKLKHYFRYADDIVLLSDNKDSLHQLLAEIREYFDEKLKLTIKQNYQIFPVEARGIDFCGYVHYHDYVHIRKSIKQNFARKLKKNRNSTVIASYKGWLQHADCKHLSKKLLNDTIN